MIVVDKHNESGVHKHSDSELYLYLDELCLKVEITNLVYLARSNNDVSSSVNSVRTKLNLMIAILGCL